jgi:hypothetical protein
MTDQVETPVSTPTAVKMGALRGRYAGVGHCGDALADALAALSLEGVEQLATDYGLADCVAKYAHLNAGQRRMNLGNKLRGLSSRKENPFPIDGIVTSAQILATTHPKPVKVKAERAPSATEKPKRARKAKEAPATGTPVVE